MDEGVELNRRRGIIALMAAAMVLVAGPVLPGMATGGVPVPGAESAAEVEASQPQAQDVVRLSGKDRYRTAVAISQHLYPSGARTVFVARGTDFPDALAGGPAAAHVNGPVLLINSATTVPSAVQEELTRLGPDRIYVLGGTSVVGGAAVNLLKQHAPVSRLSGTDRYGTAAAVAGLWSSASTVYIASGRSYPDALAGGAAAVYQGAPVLLAGRAGLSSATTDRLRALRPTRVVVLGGENAVPAAAVNQVRSTVPAASVARYAGKDRYATAATVAAKVWPQGANSAFFATGVNYADALAGVPAAGGHGVPLLLVRQACAPTATLTATTSLGVKAHYVLGGQGAVAHGATSTSCTPPASDTVLQVLEEIPVKGRAPRTGYDRSEFGPEWTDNVDVQGGRNGCDTRNDVLRRDLDTLVVRPGSNGCVAQTGWLNEPFSNERQWFERGVTSSGIHIDHLVALSDAWQKGAQQLTPTQRANFANDPLNLWAVDGGLNMQKGDGDAATWLPPHKPIRCDYVAAQVAVKHKYTLWVTAAEKTAIVNLVSSSCPGKQIPTANDVPQPRS